MKIEKIDENRLKITLPVSYFTEQNISIEHFTQNSPELQEFFCDLMETVEEKYGFSFTNSIIKVEASISSFDSDDSDKEVVLILTRTKKDANDTSLVDRYIKRKLSKNIVDSDIESTNVNNANIENNKKYVLNYNNFKNTSSDTLVCEFNNFDTLCNLAKNVNTLYTDYNSLYKIDSKYYLVFKKPNLMGVFLIFHEFGEIIPNSDFAQGYLNEYGKLLILGNAIKCLEQMSI